MGNKTSKSRISSPRYSLSMYRFDLNTILIFYILPYYNILLSQREEGEPWYQLEARGRRALPYATSENTDTRERQHLGWRSLKVSRAKFTSVLVLTITLLVTSTFPCVTTLPVDS